MNKKRNVIPLLKKSSCYLILWYKVLISLFNHKNYKFINKKISSTEIKENYNKNKQSIINMSDIDDNEYKKLVDID